MISFTFNPIKIDLQTNLNLVHDNLVLFININTIM